MKEIVFVAVGAISVVLLLSAVFGARAAGPTPTVVSRWQVVNPTPTFQGNTMLLDSATGQTWITCVGAGVTGWCDMERGAKQAAH